MILKSKLFDSEIMRAFHWQILWAYKKLKSYEVNILFKRHWIRRGGHNKFWQNLKQSPRLLKSSFSKKNWKILKIDIKPAILIQKSLNFFCKNFQFIIDIWQGRNAFELVDVSYYKEVRLSLTRIFSVANVLESLWLSW